MLAAASSGNWELRKAVLSSGFDLVAKPERKAGPWLARCRMGEMPRSQKALSAPSSQPAKPLAQDAVRSTVCSTNCGGAAVVQDGSLPAQVI